MSQTTYSAQPDLAFAGMLDGALDGATLLSRFNEESVSIAYGLMVRQGTAENQILNLSAGDQDFLGVTRHDHTEIDSAGQAAEIDADGGKVSIVRRGRVWVVTEETIALTDSVFFRFATGSGTVLGAFRTDRDGVAEVSTLTPTAVNDTQYGVRVIIEGTAYTFHVTGDASATATEICDDFRTAMAADATFTALVVATGAATLILTGQNTGQELDVTDIGAGVMTIVETTPPAPTAEALPQSRWLTATTGAGITLLELNLPQ